METSFNEITISALNIVEFARCPYIHDIYSKLMLEGFCKDSYSGLYNIHVSHLATLTVFFALMVNAALLYPHYKGKTLKHLCGCLYSKEVLEKEDSEAQVDAHIFNNDFLIEDMEEDSEHSEHSEHSDEDEDEDEEAGERGADRRGGAAPLDTVDSQVLDNLNNRNNLNNLMKVHTEILSPSLAVTPPSIFSFITRYVLPSTSLSRVQPEENEPE
jgi:hypothetical protein